MLGDEALGRARTPYLLNQLGELPVVHCIQTDQHIGLAVVVWRGKENIGLILHQCLPLTDVDDAKHECIRIGAQPTQ